MDPFARPSRPAAPVPVSDPAAEVSEQPDAEDATEVEAIAAEVGEASVEAGETTPEATASEAETLVGEA